VLVGATVVALGLLVLIYTQAVALLDSVRTSDYDTRAQEWLATLNSATGLYYLGLFTSAIAVIAWLSRAVDNTPSLGGGTPAYTPRAAIYWWFIPFANFVMPYRVVADLWRRMAIQPERRGTVLVLTWWLAWICSNIAQNVIAQMSGVDTVDGYQTFFTVAAGLTLINAAAGVVLMRVIWVIEGRAQARAASLSAVPAGLDAVRVDGADVTASPPPAPFCPRCGAWRVEGAQACASCGTAFSGT
jgi:hypothetical protein